MPGKSTEEANEDKQLFQNDEKVRGQLLEQTFVLILRGEKDEDSDAYVEQLEQNGLRAVRVPVLTFEYINRNELLFQLRSSDSFAGLIFSSPRCVSAVAEVLKNEHRTTIQKWANKLFFCVGLKSAEMLKDKLGFQCSLGDEQASIGSGADLGEYLTSRYKEKISQPLLMPCSSLSKNTLEVILAPYNMQIKRLHVYHTKPDSSVSDGVMHVLTTHSGKELIVVFFSPSGVDSVLPTLKQMTCDSVRLAAIGKTTAAHLASLGCDVWCVSEKPNPKSLAEALIKKLTV